MRIDFRKANVVMPDGTVHSEVRFVFLRGVMAIWHVDFLNWGGHRILRATDARFLKRKTAREPHLVQLSDGGIVEVRPLYAGGCSCNPHPLKQYSSEQLTAESFTATPEPVTT